MKFSTILYTLGFTSIVISAINFVEGKKIPEGDRKDDKQHDGNFIGHWAPTFFILGKIVEDREQRNS